jgi:type VII secretion-associated protein (TIGR03931 family)
VLREIVDLLQAVLAAAPAAPGPVLLVGGVARAPLLAEVVDAAGVADAVVSPRPDAAAVLGALALPPVPVEAAHPEAMAPQPRLLPPVPRPPPRRLRRGLMGVAGVGVAGALLGAGSLLPGGSAPAAVPSGVLVQYGYRLDVPSGWEHTGGLPERRRSLLTPAATPDGSDLIAVERTPLGYVSAAEPDRAHAELRAVYDAAVAAGSPLSGFADDRVRGRAVTTYQQRDGSSVVEWFVVLDADAQLSVGCRHTPSGTQAVRAACEVVVGSIRRS